MSKQLTPEQIALGNHLTQCYNDLNAYDLVLRYVASQRPKTGQLKSDVVDGFKIHTLKPSFQDPKTGEVTSLQANSVFNMELPLPEVDPADEADMKRLWPSLTTGRRHEAKKHMKFSKLKPITQTFKRGLQLGKRYIDEGEDLNLMDILKRKGYKVGNFYPCKQLRKDIEASTGKGVKIDFGIIPPIKGQVLENVMFLNEVCLLHDKDAENRVTKKRPQSFPTNGVFLLEDLEYRFMSV